MRFIKHWKAVFLSLTSIAILFLIWDAIFTANGVWGFNPDFHLPILLFVMPIDEWMFFICIPYASIFIHYSLAYFKPNLLLSEKKTKFLTLFLMLILITITLLNTDKAYTFVNFGILFLILLIGFFFGLKYLQRFYISFIIILVPFFIVNGVLTGTGIDEPIVWYNNSENLNMRLLTIPVEDVGYAFTMIFSNILLIEKLKRIL